MKQEVMQMIVDSIAVNQTRHANSCGGQFLEATQADKDGWSKENAEHLIRCARICVTDKDDMTNEEFRDLVKYTNDSYVVRGETPSETGEVPEYAIIDVVPFLKAIREELAKSQDEIDKTVFELTNID